MLFSTRSNANLGDFQKRPESRPETVDQQAPQRAAISACSALAGLETRVHLVDDVNAALAANQTVGAVAAFQGFQ